MNTRTMGLLLALIGGTAMAQESAQEMSDEGAAEARSDVLLIDRVDRTAHVPTPGMGQTMEQVEASFGVPGRRLAPVGDPPITRWVYDDFTVYFEGNRVIHSVVNRASDTESLGP